MLTLEVDAIQRRIVEDSIAAPSAEEESLSELVRNARSLIANSSGVVVDDDGYVRVRLNDESLAYVGHVDGDNVRFDVIISLFHRSKVYPLERIRSMAHDVDGTVHVVVNGLSRELWVYPSRKPVPVGERHPVKAGTVNRSSIVQRPRLSETVNPDDVPSFSNIRASEITARLRYFEDPTAAETETAVEKFRYLVDSKIVHDRKSVPSKLFTFAELNALLIEGFICESDDGRDLYLARVDPDDFLRGGTE